MLSKTILLRLILNHCLILENEIGSLLLLSPDHSTINCIRSERLQDVLKQIFAQVVMQLVDHGLISYETITRPCGLSKKLSMGKNFKKKEDVSVMRHPLSYSIV